MSELNFLKGVDAALPAQRIVDTFYVTTDTKKIMLNDAVWQDTEDVKAEIKEIIEDNELVIAAALTELKDTKADTSAITEAFDTKQDVLVSGVNIKTINNQSILGSGNIALDFSFYNLVTELPTSNIDSNKIYVIPSESGGDKNLYTEYMYVNGAWEIIGTYAASVNLDGYATEDWVNQQGFAYGSDLETLRGTLDNYALQEDLESLSGSVLDNEVTVAAALTDLEETKADKTEIPSLDGYATEDWVNQQGFLTEVASEFITESELTAKGYATETFVNQGLSGKQETLVSGTNIKTINNQSLLGSGDIAIDLSLFKVVSELPVETSDIDINKIYLVQSQEGEDGNVYIEYMYVNNAWEEVGKYKAAINLDPYALKTEVEAVDGRVTELSGSVLDNEVVIAAALTDLEETKADKTEIPSLNGYATEEWVNQQGFLTEVDGEFITETELTAKGYATEEWVNQQGFLTEVAGEFITESELTAKGYATESWVNEQIANVDVSDELANYYTKEEINNKGYLTAVPDTFVTEEELGTAIENKVDSSALTESLEAYALQADLETLSGNVLDNEVVIAAALTDLEETKADKTEIPSLNGYATEEWVENLDYVSAEELANQGYATETFVNQGLSGKQETLVSGTNIKTINGESLLIDSTSTETNIVLDVNIFKVVSSLPTEASEIETNKIYLVLSPESAEGNVYIEYMYINNTWEEIGKYTATINLDPYALKTEVEAVDGRVTELSGNVLSNEVTIAAALTDLNNKKLDSSALTENLGVYALKSDMETADALLQENIDAEVTAREEAIAELVQEIEDNELITVQALTDLKETKLDKTEVPSMEGYATEAWVADNFSQVEVDLSDYYTKSEVDAQLANIDLSDYYNKSEVDAIVTALNDEIMENETVTAKALTQLNDTKANIDEIPSYATQIRVLNESGLFNGTTIEEVLIELYNMINPQNEA